MTTPLVQPISDEQLAEIEKAASRSYGETTIVSKQEIASIIARLRAAETDAKRYRWLRGKFGIMENNISLPCGYRSKESIAQMAREADAAIDAAMADFYQ